MAIVPLNLQDLQLGRAIVDKDGRPTTELLTILNGNIRNLKTILKSISDTLTDQQALLDAINAGKMEDARTSSYTAPTNVLSAADAGSSATITIASHTRVYPSPDVADVALTGGAITGLAYSTTYFVYYDDPTLAATTVTYMATTNVATAQVGAAAGRHFVGKVATPAAGGGTTSGSGGYAPGGGGGIPIP